MSHFDHNLPGALLCTMKKANYALTKAKKERDRAEEGWVGPHLTGPRKVWAGVFCHEEVWVTNFVQNWSIFANFDQFLS